MKSHIIVILVVLFVLQPVYADTEKAVLLGVSENSKNTVKFRTVDQGEILFDEDYNLPTTISVDAGVHELSVMCEFFFEDGFKLVPGKSNILTKPGKTYLLRGVLAEDGNTCSVEY